MNTKANFENWRLVSAKGNFSAANSTHPMAAYRNAILQYDDVMMNWLNASNENKQQFLSDPAGCFQKIANPDNKTLELLSSLNSISLNEIMQMEDRHSAFEANSKTAVAAPNSSGSSISTHGWDLAAAIKVEKLNKLLSFAFEKKVLPQAFDYTTTIKFLSLVFQVHLLGTLGAPTISGGTGENINISFPITSGKLIFNNITYSLGSNASLILTVNLECVETTREDNSTVYTFYLKLHDKAMVAAAVNGLPPEVIDALGGASVIAAVVTDAVIAAAKEASIKICEVSASDIPSSYSYLVPKTAKYCFKQFATLEESILAVLVLTVSQKEGTRVIDDNAIPDGCDGSVIIQNQLFMKNILAKSIASSCNTTVDNLDFRTLSEHIGHPVELFNKNAFNYKQIEGYTPKITSLTVSEYDNYLYIHMNATVTPTAGINLHYNADGKYSASFSDASGGTQEFELTESSFDSGHTLDIEWWVWTIAALASVVALWVGGVLVGVIVGVLSAGIAGMVGGIISACAPSGLDSSTFTSAAAAVKWEHSDIVTFKKIGLFGDLQLGLTIPIIDSI